MPTLDDVKRAVCEAIDRQSEKIVTVGETIRKSPELGFKEFKTAKLVEETMREIGLSPKRVGGARGPPSPSWASWTGSWWRGTRWLTRRRAPLMPAAITPRWRACWA